MASPSPRWAACLSQAPAHLSTEAEATCRPSAAVPSPSCLLPAPATQPAGSRAPTMPCAAPGLWLQEKGGWFAFEAEEEPALGVDLAVGEPGAGLVNWGAGGAAAPTGQPALPSWA